MPDSLVYHSAPPSLLPLYGKALLPKQEKPGEHTQIPELQADLLGVASNSPALREYQRICGFKPVTQLPITWPHILSLPLQLKLLTEKSFPLPLLGLVHLRNSITRHRPLRSGENLDLQVRLGNQQRTDKGIEFDLISQARAAGTLVWEETSTNLYRIKTPAQTASARTRPELEHYPFSEVIRAPENLGRAYGKVSGDCNPIHMHALTAKAFGFPRAIAHGMWSKAHALALLEQQEGWQQGPVEVSCQFKKPLFLPGTAQLNWRPGKAGWDYQILNARGDAPHLSGRIRWLS